MIREISANLYRLTTYGITDNKFIEVTGKSALYKYIAEQELHGAVITNVVRIMPNGKTTRVAFRNDTFYKTIKAELNNK